MTDVQRSVVSVCKRGHRTYGHPNYCGTCGTKVFVCHNCGDEISFDRNHACMRGMHGVLIQKPDRIEVESEYAWIGRLFRRIFGARNASASVAARHGTQQPSQFPRPAMQEIGKSSDPPLGDGA